MCIGREKYWKVSEWEIVILNPMLLSLMNIFDFDYFI